MTRRWTSCCCGSVQTGTRMGWRRRCCCRWMGVRAGDGAGVASAVMDLVSVLSAAGVPRALLHAAGQAGALSEQEQAGGVGSEVVDEALGRLAGSSLLILSVDGGTVAAHRLVMRVIREQLARQEHLASPARRPPPRSTPGPGHCVRRGRTARPAGIWSSRSWPCTSTRPRSPVRLTAS